MCGLKTIFENRRDAGRKLAEKLANYSGKSVVVLAIPNGGVPVALEVARALKADLDLIICRKLPIPLAPEGGFGACSDDGAIILNEEIVRRFAITPLQIEDAATKVRADIKKRILLYKKDRLPTRIAEKTVIIVDDGLASGITMRAAVGSVRRRHPREVFVAVPCASALAYEQVSQVADRVVACAIGDQPRFAVADYYRYWYDVSDEEVTRYLSEWRVQRFRTNMESIRKSVIDKR